MVHDGYYGCYVPVGDASFDVATTPEAIVSCQRNPDHWMTRRSAGARHGPRARRTEAGRLEPARAMSLHALHPG
jgi:hypothetical protein